MLPAVSNYPHYWHKTSTVFQAGTCEDRERTCRCQSRELAGEQWPTLSVPKTWMTELEVLCPLKPGPVKAEEHDHTCPSVHCVESVTPTTSDVRRKNCPENFIFFRKISENFHRIFPENFQYTIISI